jgi:hypothetical protein
MLETQKEVDNLVHRRNNLQFSQNSAIETRARLELDLADAISRLGQLATEIAALPLGALRTAKEIEQSEQTTRKLKLEDRLNRDLGESQVEREHELALVLLKITEKETYLSGLQTRLTELGG